MKSVIILTSLLLLSGCFLESPIDDQNIKAAKARAETQRMIAEYQRDSTRVALERASDRAAARADSMYVNLRTGEVQAFDVLEDGSVVRRPPDSATNYPAIPDSWRLNHSAIPNSSAKVAAIMAANDITLPQVIEYVELNGYEVRPECSTTSKGR